MNLFNTIQIDVQPVLPHREWLYKFHSMYNTSHPQGWRVHYTHAAVEAEYDDTLTRTYWQ